MTTNEVLGFPVGMTQQSGIKQINVYVAPPSPAPRKRGREKTSSSSQGLEDADPPLLRQTDGYVTVNEENQQPMYLALNFRPQILLPQFYRPSGLARQDSGFRLFCLNPGLCWAEPALTFLVSPDLQDPGQPR